MKASPSPFQFPHFPLFRSGNRYSRSCLFRLMFPFLRKQGDPASAGSPVLYSSFENGVRMLSKRSDAPLIIAALPEDVLALFPDAIPTGIRHGTVTVRSGGQFVEVTTFRSDDSCRFRRVTQQSICQSHYPCRC